jgi:putative oxidoreductase
LPGAGLLIMRLVAGTVLIFRAVAGLSGALAIGPPLLLVFQIGLGLLLLAGLWTPVAATLAAVLAFWRLFSQLGEPWIQVLLATLGVALALLGPGAWSIDARLFGWKRVDIPDRQSRRPTSSER